MSKLFFLFSVLVIFLSLHSSVLANGLLITLSPANPTEQDNLNISYEEMEPDNCLEIKFKKDSDYLKFSGARTNPPCYTDSNTYFSFQVISSSGGVFSIDPQSAGNYELIARSYKKSCNIFGGNCKWKLEKTSNTLRFTIQPAQSNYSTSFVINPSTGKAGETFIAEISIEKKDGSPESGAAVTLEISNFGGTIIGQGSTDGTGNARIDISSRVEGLPKGTYDIKAKILTTTNETISSTTRLTISEAKGGVTAKVVCTPQDIIDGKCTLGGGEQCDKDPKNPAIITAIGCIHTNPASFIKDVLGFVIGISGGLAFLMMILGSFQMLTSAGNPETLQAGRDRLQSAVIGLLFVIFAVLLLQIIGVDILKIPGFEK